MLMPGPFFPQYNWIYDRLRVALSQGLVAAPHGVVPQGFPLFSKPIVNLRGMGAGSRTIHNANQLKQALTPGHFWMPLLTGDHLSTDCAVVNGKVVWLRHAKGVPAADGMFRYWTVLTERHPTIADYLTHWIGRNAATYTGIINVETIGDRIIEAHLRLTDQWVDLYGQGWIEALIGLYSTGTWNYVETIRQEGYSIPLFATPDRVYSHPPARLQQEVRAMPCVSSLQITFHDGHDPHIHPMPPGGMRLALINCWSLQAGKVALDRLSTAFPTDALLKT